MDESVRRWNKFLKYWSHSCFNEGTSYSSQNSLNLLKQQNRPIIPRINIRIIKTPLNPLTNITLQHTNIRQPIIQLSSPPIRPNRTRTPLIPIRRRARLPCISRTDINAILQRGYVADVLQI